MSIESKQILCPPPQAPLTHTLQDGGVAGLSRPTPALRSGDDWTLAPHGRRLWDPGRQRWEGTRAGEHRAPRPSEEALSMVPAAGSGWVGSAWGGKELRGKHGGCGLGWPGPDCTFTGEIPWLGAQTPGRRLHPDWAHPLCPAAHQPPPTHPAQRPTAPTSSQGALLFLAVT